MRVSSAAACAACALMLAPAVLGEGCDWAPKPNSSHNTNPASVAPNGIGRFVRIVDGGKDIKGRADVYTAGDGDDAFTVLHTYAPNAYARGWLHGAALKADVVALIDDEYAHFKELAASGDMDTTNSTKALLRNLGFDGAIDHVANLTLPHTSRGVLDELRGIADGSGANRTRLLAVHLFPELMQSSCTTITAHGKATPDGRLLAVRALDWDTSGALQNHPVLFVHHRTGGSDNADGDGVVDTVTLGFAGLAGVLTGVNAAGLTFASIGVGYPGPRGDFGTDNRDGEPWLFASQRVLETSSTLRGALDALAATRRTANLLINLGVGGAEASAAGAKYSSDSLVAYTPETLEPATPWHPRFTDVVWWSMDWWCATFDSAMGAYLGAHHGSLTPQGVVTDALPTVNTGNLHVLVMHFTGDGATDADLWVANAAAAGEQGPRNAYDRAYTRLRLDVLLSKPPADPREHTAE